MNSSSKDSVIAAIRELGHRVTPADVSVKTGLALHSSTMELNSIAADTGGTLEVSQDGVIVYRFPAGFETAYLLKGLIAALAWTATLLFNLGYYLLRISFGLMLVISLLVVVLLMIVAIVAMIAAALSDSSGGGGGDIGDLGGGSSGFFELGDIFDIFCWSPDPIYLNIGYYGHTGSQPASYIQTEQQVTAKSNFFLECFSFLFGDGDPNADLEERRWQLIAGVIRSKLGVITAEELAPYTGADPKNDSGVLPVLARFDGRPEVTETGNIIYVFPLLQVSAGKQNLKSLPTCLEERYWKFSAYPPGSLIKVLIFASLNFAGSWWLFKHVATILVLQHFVVLIDILLGYGVLFLAIPLLRLMSIVFLNIFIQHRNSTRLQYADALSINASPALQDKLRESREFAIQLQLVGRDKITYTTDRDYLEQQLENLQKRFGSDPDPDAEQSR